MNKIILLDPNAAWEWADFVGYIKKRTNAQQFGSWFSALEPISRTDDELLLGVPTPFECDGIREHHMPLLREAAEHFYRRSVHVQLIVSNVPSDEGEAKEESATSLSTSLPKPAIVKDVQRKEVEAVGRVGFSSRVLVQATFPHSKPGVNEYIFERRNGHITLKLIADPKYGLPYGTYARLIMIWIVAEAVRTKSPVLRLGKSLRHFMAQLGLAYGGGKKGAGPRVLEHLHRLFTCMVSVEMRRAGKFENIGFRPVEKISMFWDPKTPTHLADKWLTEIRLNQTFFEELISQPVPLRMDAVHALALGKHGSAMALDIYQWLTHRFSYLSEPAIVPWDALQAQFGGDYGRLRDFKKKFLQHLKVVLDVYREANVEATRRGLLLRPSRTHVPMRVLKGGKKS